jgi:hypothetical protein
MAWVHRTADSAAASHDNRAKAPADISAINPASSTPRFPAATFASDDLASLEASSGEETAALARADDALGSR